MLSVSLFAGGNASPSCSRSGTFCHSCWECSQTSGSLLCYEQCQEQVKICTYFVLPVNVTGEVRDCQRQGVKGFGNPQDLGQAGFPSASAKGHPASPALKTFPSFSVPT